MVQKKKIKIDRSKLPRPRTPIPPIRVHKDKTKYDRKKEKRELLDES